MPTIRAKDGASIFYKDWGSGQPIVFSHGWPLSADAWDAQLFHFASNGFRAIAHDRRGHGRSTQTWKGNDMNTYADDLAALVDELDLSSVIHVGHSTGGGEVVRYVGRHGTERVAKIILVSAVPPFLLKTDTNPDGAPIETFDAIRAGILADTSQYFKDFSGPFYGANRSGSKVSQGIRDQFWRISMQGGFAPLYECIAAFSATDFRNDLSKIDVPTLIIQGDDDQIVPINISGLKMAKLIKGATLKVYQGAPHGLMSTHQTQFNNDLLDFSRTSAQAEVPARRESGVSSHEQPRRDAVRDDRRG
jgi:non-heme chloroperoxidase